MWLNEKIIITQRTEELGLFVFDEEDHETLLLHRISADDIYRKQEGIFVCWCLNILCYSFLSVYMDLYWTICLFSFFEDTIISWRDPEFSTELALSFQETTGCSYIWYYYLSLALPPLLKFISFVIFHLFSSFLLELFLYLSLVFYLGTISAMCKEIWTSILLTVSIFHWLFSIWLYILDVGAGFCLMMKHFMIGAR